MSKYKNIKVMVDGIKFDSKAEARRYAELKLMEDTGHIKELKLQPKFELQPKYKNSKGQCIRAITYKADFSYIETHSEVGKLIVEDVKGVETKEFKLKKKMLEYKFPDIDFRIIK